MKPRDRDVECRCRGHTKVTFSALFACGGLKARSSMCAHR